MRRFWGLMAVLVTLPGVAEASINPGDLITFSRASGLYSGNGGEFTATVTDHTSHALLQQFQTFCVEEAQTIGLGTTYEVHSVLDRSVTGPTFSPDSYGSLPADKIEGPTAWLFLQFWNTLYGGTVSAAFTATDYLDLVAGGNSRATNAGLLQNAIWYLESNGLAGSTNAYTTMANSNSAGWADALTVVRAVNPIADGNLNGIVTAGDTNASVHRQTQLIVIPSPPGSNQHLPEPTSLIVWVLLGSIVGVVAHRRYGR